MTGLSWIGSNRTPLLAILGATGIIPAFALQNMIGGFDGGLSILFQHPFVTGHETEAAA